MLADSSVSIIFFRFSSEAGFRLSETSLRNSETTFLRSLLRYLNQVQRAQFNLATFWLLKR